MTATSIFPATEAALRIADEIRSAVANRTPLRVQGGGYWLDAGAPVSAAKTLDVREEGIVSYVPGDLTVTVLAGTSLATIAAAVSEGNQWLALDPFGGGRGSIGATIATASYGPLAQMFGTPRDQLLGVEFVSGEGDIIRGGGQVTKNVAGFDLCRLCCGAWGTTGVITEVTLRLRAIPDRDVTLAIALTDRGTGHVGLMLERVRAARLTPAAMELVAPSICSTLALDTNAGDAGVLLLRFCGNDDGVKVQMDRVRSTFSATTEHPSTVWTRLTESQMDSGEMMVLRISSRPAKLGGLWDFALTLAENFAGSHVHASPGRGVLRCTIPAKWQSQLGEALAARPEPLHRGGLLFEKLPAPLWPVLAPPDALSDPLNTGVRNAFDPYRILNRGILGEGVS